MLAGISIRMNINMKILTRKTPKPISSRITKNTSISSLARQYNENPLMHQLSSYMFCSLWGAVWKAYCKNDSVWSFCTCHPAYACGAVLKNIYLPYHYLHLSPGWCLWRGFYYIQGKIMTRKSREVILEAIRVLRSISPLRRIMSKLAGW